MKRCLFQGLKMKSKITVHLLIAKESKEMKRAGGRIGFHILVLSHPCLAPELLFFFPHLHSLAKKRIWDYVNVCFCGDIQFCIFSTSVSALQISLLYLFALKRQPKSNQKGVWLGYSDNCPLVGMREWMVQWTPQHHWRYKHVNETH